MISMLNENITLMVGGRELEDFKTNETAVEQVKLRRCEKATKSPTCFDKTAVFTR